MTFFVSFWSSHNINNNGGFFMMQSMCDLTDKQVINICDGRILGYVIDFKLDPYDGRLTAIIIPGEGGVFGFKRSTDIIIPWDKIYKIGIDVILVDIGIMPKDGNFGSDNQEKKKKFKLF